MNNKRFFTFSDKPKIQRIIHELRSQGRMKIDVCRLLDHHPRLRFLPPQGGGALEKGIFR
ncbi:MAG: hypothetical protein A2Z46_01020 [Nitrospirae bacterium RBG_19FT_COMBO_55_12]|nr:MAG: hypothetical protein A2Z46_01020 [Nitrospirae bacterium RBG_19FT_COMBO_55_12]